MTQPRKEDINLKVALDVLEDGKRTNDMKKSTFEQRQSRSWPEQLGLDDAWLDKIGLDDAWLDNLWPEVDFSRPRS